MAEPSLAGCRGILIGPAPHFSPFPPLQGLISFLFPLEITAVNPMPETGHGHGISFRCRPKGVLHGRNLPVKRGVQRDPWHEKALLTLLPSFPYFQAPYFPKSLTCSFTEKIMEHFAPYYNLINI